MIEFLEAAEEEFLEAIDRYEEKQEGLGARFLAEVERVSDRLEDWPRMPFGE